MSENINGPVLAASLDDLKYLVFQGMKGETGPQGPAGTDGDDGHSPYINETGYWVFWNDSTGAWVTTNYKAAGRDGEDGHSPYIGANGHWFAWSEQLDMFDDTGVAAQGSPGTPGTDGTDGVSPTVTVTNITGGHRVTITDKTHPTGQSFDVMDGEGGNGVFNINVTRSGTEGSYIYAVDKTADEIMEHRENMALTYGPMQFAYDGYGSSGTESGNFYFSLREIYNKEERIAAFVIFANRNTDVVTVTRLDDLTIKPVAVDDSLSGTSTNPVQNKAVKQALDGKGTYSKPSGGIPKSDLAQAVQTSLGKADTALQEHQSLSGYATETYVQQQIAAIPDELPSVSASDNGKVLGVVNGAWAAKADEGGGGGSVTVDSALSATSENPVQNKVVKAALDGKQDTLTAGQNVTISGNTISADVDSAEIASNVTNWLEDNVDPVGSAVVVDSSLSIEGAAADAKAVGDAISALVTITPEIKNALLSCLQNVAWANPNGQSYVNALNRALNAGSIVVTGGKFVPNLAVSTGNGIFQLYYDSSTYNRLGFALDGTGDHPMRMASTNPTTDQSFYPIPVPQDARQLKLTLPSSVSFVAYFAKWTGKWSIVVSSESWNTSYGGGTVDISGENDGNLFFACGFRNSSNSAAIKGIDRESLKLEWIV